MTTVASVTHTGYRRRPGGGYHSQSLPPLEFRYSRAVIGREPRDLGEDALRNLPVGIDGRAYQWLDLDGEGISGVLAREGGAWFYKANLGDGRFAPERMLATQPAAAGGRAVTTRNGCSTSPVTATWTSPTWAGLRPASTSGPSTAAGGLSGRSGLIPTSPGTIPTCAWSTSTGTAWPTC